MSLIQEALRRKREEDENPRPREQATLTPPPPTPVRTLDVTPEPEVQETPPPVEGSKQKGKSFALIVGSLVLITFLLAGSVAAILLGAKLLAGAADGSQNKAQVEAPAATAVGTDLAATKTPAAADRPAEPSRESVVTTPIREARGEQPPSSITTSEPQVLEVTMRRNNGSGVRQANRPSSSRAARTVGRTEVVFTPPSQSEGLDPAEVGQSSGVEGGESDWPILRITGIMARPNPDRSAVIINNQLVAIGEEIQGVKVSEIEQNEVVLVFRGEMRPLRVGQSTR